MEKRPSKKELLKMPVRGWNDTEREYRAVLLVPAGTKHNSGYMHIAIVGVYVEDGANKYEVCAWPDDIACHFPTIVIGDDKNWPLVRMDCFYPSGVLQYHGNGTFNVGAALSSTDIYFEPR